MNRYDVLRLVQELGRLVESAPDKTLEAVAHELIACGERRLAEARTADSAPNQSPVNGSAVPVSMDGVAAPGPGDTVRSADSPVSAGTIQA